MPGTFVNKAGVWTEVGAANPVSAKVSGAYVPVKEIHVKRSGAWSRVWPPIAPTAPTNLRFNYTVWQNNRYEAQVVWDPIDATLADGYEIEVTRIGGANPANAVVVDMARVNHYEDIYIGTTGGIQLKYRIRSYKTGYRSVWSGYLNATTPGDAGFCRSNLVNGVGDVWGNMYVQIIHDGNANNVYLDMTRSQEGYYTYTPIRRYAIGGGTYNYVDQLPSDHYRGPKAGNVNTQDAYSAKITWSFYTVNSWGKPNGQNGSPYPADWGDFPNEACWRLGRPADGTLRINAVGTNVYRRQPANSVGWVGGVPRCGGNQGDLEGCWLWDKNVLTDKGIRNRARAGHPLFCGYGRRNDSGNFTCSFTLNGLVMYWGMSDPPGPLTAPLFNRSWQKGVGELFQLPDNWRDAYVTPGNNYGGMSVTGDNTANTYAEFGYQGEIVGGWVNGQFNMINSLV